MSPARRTFNLAPTPDTTGRADDWRDSAACLVGDPERFFIPGDKWSKHPDQEAKAKAICADCPVVAECLEHAYKIGDKDGIRGGLTPNERDRLRRNATRRRTPPPEPGKCRNGHDLTTPGARYPNRNCRQCALDRQARVRNKQKEAKAS